MIPKPPNANHLPQMIWEGSQQSDLNRRPDDYKSDSDGVLYCAEMFRNPAFYRDVYTDHGEFSLSDFRTRIRILEQQKCPESVQAIRCF